MDHSSLKSTLAALLLLSVASISVQQSPPSAANSSTTAPKLPNQGAVTGNSGLSASQGVPASPPLGSVTPPPPPIGGNSLPSPPPPLPIHSSGNPHGVPSSGSSPPPPPVENPKGTPREEKEGGAASSVSSEEVRMCDGKSAKCGDSLVFCFLDPPKDPKKQLLIVRNNGTKQLHVSVANSSSTVIVHSITLGANESKKIELAVDAVHSYEMRLDHEKTKCPLSLKPPPPPLSVVQPASVTRLNPIYMAYAILFTVLLSGGACAWHRFRRRAGQANSGIPYQQLEMGMQMQSSYAAVDTSHTAEVWDQGWDDNWDDEEAATGAAHGTSAVSSNGAAATKSSVKDGWDDWDD